jgi:ornithine decarboxylase
MTERIREFLRNRRDDGPCLVVDLDVVRDNYSAFAKALPDTRVFYAVKANPAPEVLALLAKLGSCFDTASVAEIEMVIAAGATPDRVSYGNTIKKERDIARAFALGVRLYAIDCKPEVEKVARVAPGSRVFCRILSDCVGAEWPLSRKFGCEPGMAVDVLEHALRLGLKPYGVSFHVGSQQRNQHAWDRALASAAAVFRECGERGMQLSMVNLGGGFPTKYLKNVPSVKTYGSAIFKALRKHFGNRIPETIIEPGRGMVGNAGVIESEVVCLRILIERDASAHHLPGGCHDVIGIWTHPVEHLGRCGWRRIRKCDALIVRAVHVLRHARNNLGARAERIIGLIEREQALGLLHRFDQCFRVHRLERAQVNRFDLHPDLLQLSSGLKHSRHTGAGAHDGEIAAGCAHGRLVERYGVLLIGNFFVQLP